jgi:hypothetical protein
VEGPNKDGKTTKLKGKVIGTTGVSATAFPQRNRYQSLTANLSGVRIHYLKAGMKTLVRQDGGHLSERWRVKR